MISQTMEMMLAALSVIWGGVVDRHPRLRVAFLQSGGGWIAPWLDRMDRHFDPLAATVLRLQTSPSAGPWKGRGLFNSREGAQG